MLCCPVFNVTTAFFKRYKLVQRAMGYLMDGASDCGLMLNMMNLPAYLQRWRLSTLSALIWSDLIWVALILTGLFNGRYKSSRFFKNFGKFFKKCEKYHCLILQILL